MRTKCRGASNGCQSWRSLAIVAGQKKFPLAALALLVAVLLSGCAFGESSSRSMPRQTATPAPTSQPTLPGVVANAALAQACAGASRPTLHINQVQVGEYDSWQALAVNLPLKPEPTSAITIAGNVALNSIDVIIGLNAQAPAATGTICAVTARIIAYQALATPIPNVTRVCSDHAYTDPGGADYGGDCGVAPAPEAATTLAFSTNAVGTTVSAPIQSTIIGKPALFPPANNSPSQVLTTLKMPVSGVYTITLGLWQDSTGPTLLTLFHETFDTAVLHEWSGQACVLASMQAQLPPPTDPPTQLLCPGAPPMQ